MNYYNPSFYNIPTTMGASSPGLFKTLLGGAKGINWGSILSNTQKVIGIANQAIPVIRQVSPVMKNAKTMFKVMNEFKKVDAPNGSANTNKANPKTNNFSQRASVAPTTNSNNQQPSTRENIPRSDVQTDVDEGPSFFI